MNYNIPSMDSLSPRRFAEWVSQTCTFFTARGRPFVWSVKPHIYCQLTDVEAEEWLTTYISPDYKGEIPVRFLRETLRYLLRDQTHKTDIDKLTVETQNYTLFKHKQIVSLSLGFIAKDIGANDSLKETLYESRGWYSGLIEVDFAGL